MRPMRASPVRALALAVGLFAFVPAASAQVLTTRFTADVHGGIAVAANTLVACDASDAACLEAQGAAVGNDQLVMSSIDADGDPATVTSSFADLVLPVGASVRFAGLYWGGRLPSTPDGLATATLVLPDGTSSPVIGAVDTAANAYQSFVDVTEAVAAHGAGRYGLANVSLGQGVASFGGFSVVVVYDVAGGAPRSVSIVDGLEDLPFGGSVDLTVSGLQVPPAGRVSAELGVVAYETDAGRDDGLSVQGVPVAEAGSTAGDIFSSLITTGGVDLGAREPRYGNNLGFDARVFTLVRSFTPGVSSAAVRFESVDDRYLVGVAALAVELDDRPSAEAEIVDVDGGSLLRGDTVEMRLRATVPSTGADDVELTIAVPDGVVVEAGSLEIVLGGGGIEGPITDAPGDDQGEVLLSERIARVRLGVDATPAAGGRISGSGVVAVRVRGRVSGVVSHATLIGASGEIAGTVGGSPVRAPALARPLSVVAAAGLSVTGSADTTPIVPGELASARFRVENRGPLATTGGILSAAVPVGVDIVSATVGTGVCAVSDGVGTCQLGPLAVGAGADVEVVTRSRSPGTFVVTATAANSLDDPDRSDNTASVSIVVGPPPSTSNLAVTADFSATPVIATATRASIVVANRGPGDASDASLSFTRPYGVTMQAVAPATGTCQVFTSVVRCRLGAIAADRSVEVVVIYKAATLGRLTFVAAASSGTSEVDTSDNTAVTLTQVRPRPTRLGLSVTGPRTTVRPGARIRIPITVRARGRYGAYRVRVEVTLPPSTTVISAPGARFERGRLVLHIARLQTRSRTVIVTLRVSRSAAQGRSTVAVRVGASNAGALARRFPVRVAGRPLAPR